jgi:predicted ATP-dependent endonuclease of OLD family
MIIKSVEIEGFWGKYKAVSNFNQDVNIFVGLNGTGKTTFINLIVGVLLVDIQQLQKLQFTSINIRLIDPNKKNIGKNINVVIEPAETNYLKVFKYKVGTYVYRVYADLRYRPSMPEREVLYRMATNIREQYTNLKIELSKLIEISQISVYRQSSNKPIDADNRQKITAVDERLQQLLQKFAIYQLKLEAELNEESKSFQKKIISSLLYAQEFDTFNIENLNTVANTDLNTEENKLSQAFEELGIKNQTKQITNHINKLRDAINGIKQAINGKEANEFDIELSDAFALPLISRTNKIIDLLNISEETKKKITEPRRKFFAILREFMPNKEFDYDNKTSKLTFSLNKSKSLILEWLDLSSGDIW